MCVFKETRGKEQGSVLKLQESPSLQKNSHLYLTRLDPQMSKLYFSVWPK